MMMQDVNIKELLEKDKARIRWVNYGIANTFSYAYKDKEYKIIEINKDLIDEPKLFYPILFHELSHTKKLFSPKDVLVDFSPANISSLPNIKIVLFSLSRPSTWVQYLPLYKTKRQGWVFDINLCMIYIVAILLTFFLLK